MPSLGFEFDYDLTPNLAIGLGHRMTFSGTDLLDGQRWTDANTLTGDNDVLHYTSLGLKYRFNKHKNRSLYPKIELVEPFSNELTIYAANSLLKVKIHRVNNPFDIYLTVNGKEQYFNFNNRTLIANIPLTLGKNNITITAHNQDGTDSKEYIFFRKEKEDVLPELEAFGSPEIIFINPSVEDSRVRDKSTKVTAKVRMVDNEKDIRLTVNGRKVAFDFDKNKELLSANLGLKEGRNIIEIKARNKNGEQLSTTSIFYELPVPSPYIEFVSPRYDNTETTQSTIEARVKLDHISSTSDVRLVVNGVNEPNFYFENNLLSANIRLLEGQNNIEVFAINPSGEERKQIIIHRKSPYVPVVRRPKIAINAPKYRESTTREPYVVIHANLEHISRKTDIRLTHNGNHIYDFNFDANAGVLQHGLYLSAGLNQVLIEGSNQAGEDRAEVIINLVIPAPPPVIVAPSIDWIRPHAQTVVEAEELTVKANIVGVTGLNDINFRVNNRNYNDFRFNPATGNFRAKVRLREGENSLSIEVSNGAGYDRHRTTIIYHPPYAPIIDIRKPESRQTAKKYISLKADVRHVTSRKDIQLFVNSKNKRNFSFKKDRLEADIELDSGENIIEIIASNSYGQKQLVKRIVYTPPLPPKITFNGIKNNQIFKTRKVKIKANIDNIENRKAIKLFWNGRASGNFDWSNGLFTSNTQLREGKNTLKLKVETTNGKDEVDLTLHYRQPRLPVIDFTNFSNEEEVTEDKITLMASIENIINRQALTVFTNGERNEVFTFRNGLLKSSTALKKGKNTITIKAKTEEGEREKNLVIFYKPLVPKPSIKIISPSSVSLETGHFSARVKASIQHISHDRKINISVNDRPIDDFQFTAKNGELTATIPLSAGKNEVIIQVENEAGIAKKGLLITRTIKRPTLSKNSKKKRESD